MKEKYLLTALWIWLLLLIEVTWLRCVILVIFTIYYVRKYMLFTLCSIAIFCFIFAHWHSIQIESVPTTGLYTVTDIKSSYVIVRNKEHKVIVYGLVDPNYHDVYELPDNFQCLDIIRNEHGFVFSDWLARKGIYYSIYVTDAKRIQEGTGIRHNLYASISQNQHAQFLKQMLYGIQKEEASYLLIASGMHISFSIGVVKKILERFLKQPHTFLCCFLMILALAFLFVCTASILRILCFQFVRYAFYHYNKKDQLGISMLCILVLAPYMCTELSFVLPVLFRLVFLFNTQKVSKGIISFLVMIPLQLLYFHECNPIQIMIFRFIRIGYGCMYILALMMVIIPMPTISIYKVITILSYIENIGFTVYGAASILWVCGWFYCVFAFISYKHLRYIHYFLGFIIFFFISPYINPFAQVYILDVGQGDCAIIITPFRKEVIMIDVMGHKTRNIPEESIIPFLYAKKITHIDTLIITHHDLDHNGGLEQLQEKIAIEQIIDTKELAKSEDISWMKFLLLDYQGEDENENSIVTFFQLYNLRFLFMGDLSTQGEQVLLTQYPELKADVLKVGHHGSKTSSSLTFLHKINPMLAFISSGRNNYYQHPHPEVLERLQQECILTLNTADKGGLSMYICPYVSIISTARHDVGFIFHNFMKD